MTLEYSDFIEGKRIVVPDAGFEPRELVAPLFPFQAQNVRWAVRRGRAALFLDTGLGKTLQQLEWARQVAEHTGWPVLILAPLAVAQQTVREAKRFGLPAEYYKGDEDPGRRLPPVVVTNYERLGKFMPNAFRGVVLDESSILKSYTGSTKRAILEGFAATPYKLACTATPAPNDHLELGNHAEFLGVMTSHEMIARWFINDTSTFGTYRLKGHAISAFWDWATSWAAMASLPSDLGDFDDAGYVLPPLNTKIHEVDADVTDRGEALTLFRMPELNATSIHTEKRRTVGARAARAGELVAAEPREQWIIWCETDYEADALRAAIPEAVEVRGSEPADRKEERLVDFIAGKHRVLITKPKIAGFGLNMQGIARVIFAGATFSFESYYQAIRRTWRFGQRRAVDVHVLMGSTERAVWDVLARKAADFDSMKREMFAAARRAREAASPTDIYDPQRVGQLPRWLACA